MKENKKMLSELTGMLSIVVEAVLHSSTHTVMWVNKRKENSSSEKVGGLRARVDYRAGQR